MTWYTTAREILSNGEWITISDLFDKVQNKIPLHKAVRRLNHEHPDKIIGSNTKALFQYFNHIFISSNIPIIEFDPPRKKGEQYTGNTKIRLLSKGRTIVKLPLSELKKMMEEVRLDIAVRWEGPAGSDSRRTAGGGWVAYNVGAKPPHAAWNWSTSLGACTWEEVLDLFRNSNVIWLPPGEKDAEFAELDFTVVC